MPSSRQKNNYKGPEVFSVMSLAVFSCLIVLF